MKSNLKNLAKLLDDASVMAINIQLALGSRIVRMVDRDIIGIAIGVDEPEFEQVATLRRKLKKKNGTWTEWEEAHYKKCEKSFARRRKS